ncbi:hypothetical protein [Sutcliffiella deserti]|uniref:hypothetical protein n=1 Tax=Sutcliffiella deserti TaxID=2875501 RepID=UPI001CBEBEB2|nr:hypothetical protein [Sutcliffiella deserti]
MWSTNVDVIIPDELLNKMEIHGTMVSPNKPDVGVLILTKGFNRFSREIVIRVYRLQRDKLTNKYTIYLELQAFAFSNYMQAKEFLANLPNMTALEMLMMLYSGPQNLAPQH